MQAEHGRWDHLLNDFAIRSFRDVADYDYIAARLCFRARLVPQFLWCGLQAIEKYFKCILLLNRVHAKHIRHDLTKALDLIKQKVPFQVHLSLQSIEVIKHFDTYGRVRYLETPFYIGELMLQRLDKTVWEIRRYCAVVNYEIRLMDGTKKSMLSLELQRIEKSEKRPPHEFRHLGGELEKILAKRTHPGRAPLVWQNFQYGARSRKRMRIAPYLHSTNSPLSLHPEMLDEVLRYVHIPKDVVQAYRTESIGSAEEKVLPYLSKS